MILYNVSLIFIIIYIIRLYATNVVTSCENGSWIDGSNYVKHPFSDVQVYSEKEDDEATDRLKEWYMQACPAESRLYSCSFQGANKKRLNKLASRKWIPAEDKKCLEFWSSNFIEGINSRRVLLIGDSLMFQTYSALICELLQYTKYSLYMNWGKNNQDHCGDDLNHCISLRSLFLISKNSSISFRRQNQMSLNFLLDTIKVDAKLKENDIVIINAGAHYHDKIIYKNLLLTIKEGFDKEDNLPSLFFLESTPSHFYSPSNPSGYWNTDYIRSNSNCTQFENLNDAKSSDWRNNVADEVFRDSSKFTIIRIADGLYSQFDAHMEMATKDHDKNGGHGNVVDCTHFCMSSDIFRYIWRMIYNHLVESHTIKYPSNQFDYITFPDHTLISDRRYGKSIFVVINGTKHRFSDNMNTFMKYGYSFENIKNVYEEEFDQIQWGNDLI